MLLCFLSGRASSNFGDEVAVNSWEVVIADGSFSLFSGFGSSGDGALPPPRV